MTKAHKRTADSLIGVATYMGLLSIGKEDPLSALYKKTSDSFEKIRVRREECDGREEERGCWWRLLHDGRKYMYREMCTYIIGMSYLSALRNWRVEWHLMRT